MAQFGEQGQSETQEKEGAGKAKLEESFIVRRKTNHPRIVPLNASSEEEQEKVERKEREKAEDFNLPCRPAQTTPVRLPQGLPPSSLGKASLGHRGAEEVSLEERCRQRLSTLSLPTQPLVHGKSLPSLYHWISSLSLLNVFIYKHLSVIHLGIYTLFHPIIPV